MGFSDWVLTYTNDDGITVQTDNIIRVRRERQIGIKGHKFEVTVNNYGDNVQDSSELIYDNGESFKLYAAKDGKLNYSNLTSANLLGTHVINDQEISPDGHFVKFVCTDKTYEMLSKIYIVKDVTDTVDGLVENIVQTIGDTDGTTTTPVTTHIATTRSDSSAFPSTRYTSVYNTAFEAVEELSQTDYTGDNLPYVYWFDENDEFWWEYPSSVAEVTEFTHGYDPVRELKTGRKDAEAVSMVIYNAGNDLNGTPIWNFYVDPAASSLKGRIKYVPMIDIEKKFKSLYAAEITAETLTNAQFIALCESAAQARASTFVSVAQRGLFTADVIADGDNYALGSLYYVSAPKYGFSKKMLRLVRIVDTFDKNGWESRLTFQEDAEAESNL